MPISDDWDFNFAGKIISHIDGILSYDTGSGAQATVGQYVWGATSGAVGKVLARTGNNVSGTLTLTNVVGQFENNELLEQLSIVAFDGVINAEKSRIVLGALITGATSTRTLTIKFIEYNIDGVAGHGTFYGVMGVTGAWTNNENIQIGGATVCLADGTGTDNTSALGTTLVDGTLAVPGTANTNNCVIVNFDGGTIAIPEDAHIADATSGAVGYAQQVLGSTAIGSIRVVDSDTTGGSWTNNNTLNIRDVVFYDNLVAGKVFSVGDVIKAVGGTTPDVVGRVLAVIDDGDNTGKLILANFSGTRFADNEIHVLQSDDTYVKYGEFENTTAILAAATINGSARTLQRADQGGIFPSASLNILRSSNALYSYAADLYDELAQLDDDPPLEGNVRDQLYTILNSYVIPDLSFRFLEKGSFKDTANSNIWTAVQTVGALADIGAWGFFQDATNPTPQPDMYIEQNGSVLRQDWLEGNLDVILKTKTSTDPKYINPTVNALGQLINNGAFTVHVRPYGRTFDSNEVTQVGGIAVVALGNAKDLNNTTAQYSAVTTGGAGTFLAGEEAKTASGKRVIINTGFAAGGTATWNNKGTVNLANADAITGSVSGATTTINAVPTNVVAGYGTDIRVMVVQRRFTGGSTTGTYVLGELVTQTTSLATGYLMEDDGGTLYIEEQSGTFTATDVLTGAVSGATNDPTGTAAFTTVPKDIGGGVGDKNYTAVVSANITNASAQTVAKVYEWWKFCLRAESTYQVNTVGGLFSAYTEGKIYRRLSTSFSEVKGASAFGAKAGSLVITAQGVFIEKYTLDSADIRSIQLVANDGIAYDPPNLQTMQMTNLVTGVRGAIYRSTGAGLTTILRNEFGVGAVGAGFNQSGDANIKVAASVRSVSPLPNDVPDTGVLRILDPNGTGNYLRFVYDVVDRVTNVFHLQSGIGQDTIGAVTGAADLIAAANVHVVFVEEQASGTIVDNIVQYVADIPLVAIARIKGKQPFRTTSTFASTGASIGAVLGADNVVNLP